VLSKDEIAKQITEKNFNLPDFLISMLQMQDERLDNEAEYLKVLHPLFCEAECGLVNRISKFETRFIFERERLFDDCLLLISIYYHYSAVLVPNVMADFLRLVLMKKILLT
jgi:hypothetical protein